MQTSPLFMESSMPSVDQLFSMVEAIVEQDESALAELYDATIAKVYGLALKITRRHDLAEEVVEDTYMQVWQEAGNFDHMRGSTIAWMMMICRSRAIDALRKLDKATSHAEPELLRQDSEEVINPLDIVMMLERESAIRIAMKTLSSTQRQLIALAFFKGYTHEEITEQMGIPLGTVKSNIKRAQHILKTVLNKESA